MATILRRLMKNKNEKGQALIEYQVLIPGAILLAIGAAWLIAPTVSDWYCQGVQIFDPEACVVAGATEESPPPPAEPTNEPDECVILQESQGGSQCDQSPDCIVGPGINNGLWDFGYQVPSFVIKAGQNYVSFGPADFDDGCYDVKFTGTTVQWERVGSGNNCKDISHVQAWAVPLCPPSEP